MPRKNLTWMLDDGDLVQPEFGCPQCGERRMDYLVWIDEGEEVKCQTCGCVYEPGAKSSNE